ncbi:MAG TPA: hypothetical protein VIJ07_00760, partial [Dermatophilaceae bacterium]
VVIAVARQLRLNPLPFAMTTVWLANTASLLLPVSNLTNLLALHRFSDLGLGHSGYVSLAVWPALAAIGATVVVLALIHLSDLRGRYSPNAPPHLMTGPCWSWPDLYVWRWARPSQSASPLPSRRLRRLSFWSAPA